MKNNRCLIINADDFGYSDAVNGAIVRSFQERLCSSATIMANMPAFAAACELAQQNKLAPHIGIHINLTEGQPLTDPIKNCRRICDSNGQFIERGRGKLFRISAEEHAAISKEISAQIERCKKHGIALSHADSHQHVHTEWAVGRILVALAKQYSIRNVRLSRARDKNSTLLKNAYRHCFNGMLKWEQLAGTDEFGTVDDLLAHQQLSSTSTRSFEVMIHPALAANGDLIDHVTKQTLSTAVQQIRGFEGAVSYNQLP